MLNNNYLTTCSVAYGQLIYKKKIVFERIEKNAILGNGYINAFLDNENSDNNNKILSGQVRILKKLSGDLTVKKVFDKINFENGTFKLLECGNEHYYFNWYLNDPQYIDIANDVFREFKNKTDNSRFDQLKVNLNKIRYGNYVI